MEAINQSQCVDELIAHLHQLSICWWMSICPIIVASLAVESRAGMTFCCVEQVLDVSKLQMIWLGFSATLQCRSHVHEQFPFFPLFPQLHFRPLSLSKHWALFLVKFCSILTKIVLCVMNAHIYWECSQKNLKLWMKKCSWNLCDSLNFCDPNFRWSGIPCAIVVIFVWRHGSCGDRVAATILWKLMVWSCWGASTLCFQLRLTL